MGGTKRVIDNQTLLESGDMSANIDSIATEILHLDRVGYQLKWTGTPTGTFGIEISQDQVT